MQLGAIMGHRFHNLRLLGLYIQLRFYHEISRLAEFTLETDKGFMIRAETGYPLDNSRQTDNTS